jgi:tol-pal system protein YbgF
MRVWLVAVLCLMVSMPAMAQNAATLAEQVSRLERRVQAMEAANLGGTGASAADLEQRMQDLEGESSQINGGVERLGNAVERLAKRVDELAKDFDLRLRDLEAAAHANGTVAGQQVAGPTAGAAVTIPQAGVTPTEAAPAAAASPTSALVPVTPGMKPADHYNRAYAYLTAGDYPNAKAWLEAFLTANPKDALADNAHYWLGEVNLVQNNPQAAVVAFKNGLAAFPKGQKAPANLLKMGIALQQMKQEQFAKGAWEKLVKDFPRSAEAEKAKAKLAELPKAAAPAAKETSATKPKS